MEETELTTATEGVGIKMNEKKETDERSTKIDSLRTILQTETAGSAESCWMSQSQTIGLQISICFIRTTDPLRLKYVPAYTRLLYILRTTDVISM
jgi:hypothetical protein